MIIRKPLVGECLQCLKKPTKEVDKYTVAVVRTNAHCKVEVVGNRNLHDCIHVPISAPLRFEHLGNSLTGKCISHRGEYGLEILANFRFYGPDKVIKFAKNQNNKDKKKLNSKILTKVKCIKFLVIGRVCYRELRFRR